MNGADESDTSSRWGGLIELQPQQIAQVFLLGATVGVVVWVVAIACRDILFQPFICGQGADAACSYESTAMAVASVIAALIGLIGLIRFYIYRPIVVVIASAMGLWELGGLVSGLFWLEAVVWSALLYGVCYTAFTWLVRPRKFIYAFVPILAFVILIRLLSVI